MPNRWPHARLGAVRRGGEVAACQARRRRLCCQSLPRFLPLHRPLLLLFIVVNPLRRSRGIFPPLDHPGDSLAREAIVPSAWDCPMKRYREISMGGARNPGDGSPARRLRGGARWGPSEPPGGGIDIDYCAFPTCPGNPRGIVSAPALRFCTLLPPPPSPTLSASHRQRRASLLPSACLSRFLSLSFFLPFRFCLSLPFSPSFFT